MRDFEFHRPASVREASRLLGEFGDDARAIAGGTALVLGLRQRLLAPAHLVSLAGIDALHGIGWDEHSGLRIGALTTHAEVARSPLVRAHCPLLADTAARMAHRQVRNQGTLGGNLCYGDPATDPPGCLLALDAQVVLAGARGERVLKLDEFVVDYFTTALEPDELLTEVRIAPRPADADGRCVRYLRTAAEHRPLVNVAIALRRHDDTCSDVRLVVGAATPMPMRLKRAEDCLAGGRVTRARIAEAAALVAADLSPLDDLRGSAAYRRQVAGVVARRTLAELFGLEDDA